MGFFNWLKGSSSNTARATEEPRAMVDWKALEEALAGSIASQVQGFVASHQNETFYGFALDCNAYYANVLFCLNTLEGLEATAREYAKGDDPEEVESQKKNLKWGLGDWKYQGFNLDTESWSTEVPMLEGFAELPNSQDTEEFLVTCCRALLRAEQSDAFSCLPRTPDFRIACIDHDEDALAGERRLASVRAST